MKILMLGLFTGNVFDGDEVIAYGFEQLGHHVTKFNYRKTPFMNFKLLTLWKQYDLLIIGKWQNKYGYLFPEFTHTQNGLFFRFLENSISNK